MGGALYADHIRVAQQCIKRSMVEHKDDVSNWVGGTVMEQQVRDYMNRTRQRAKIGMLFTPPNSGNTKTVERVAEYLRTEGKYTGVLYIRLVVHTDKPLQEQFMRNLGIDPELSVIFGDLLQENKVLLVIDHFLIGETYSKEHERELKSFYSTLVSDCKYGVQFDVLVSCTGLNIARTLLECYYFESIVAHDSVFDLKWSVDQCTTFIKSQVEVSPPNLRNIIEVCAIAGTVGFCYKVIDILNKRSLSAQDCKQLEYNAKEIDAQWVYFKDVIGRHQNVTSCTILEEILMMPRLTTLN